MVALSATRWDARLLPGFGAVALGGRGAVLVVLSVGGCGILPSAIEVGATAERFHFAIAYRPGIILFCSQFPRNLIRQVRDSEKVVPLE